jgi:hypothetical protein
MLSARLLVDGGVFAALAMPIGSDDGGSEVWEISNPAAPPTLVALAPYADATNCGSSNVLAAPVNSGPALTRGLPFRRIVDGRRRP